MKRLEELERVSLLLVMCGLAVIYVASVVYEPPTVSVQALDESFLGETVRVDAVVTRHVIRDGVQFITLEEGGERVSAVYFGDSALEVVPSSLHRVQGEVSVYEGELEIIIDSIAHVESQE